MHPVKEPVDGRREDDTDIGDKDNAAEQGIKGGEEFANRRVDINHRPHTTQYHRRIVQGVQPPDICRIVITQYTDH